MKHLVLYHPNSHKIMPPPISQSAVVFLVLAHSQTAFRSSLLLWHPSLPYFPLSFSSWCWPLLHVMQEGWPKTGRWMIVLGLVVRGTRGPVFQISFFPASCYPTEPGFADSFFHFQHEKHWESKQMIWEQFPCEAQPQRGMLDAHHMKLLVKIP